MIGQKRIQDTLEAQIKEDKLARCILLVGERGSGRKTLAKLVADQLALYKAYGYVRYNLPDNKVETVRQMIESVYRSTELTVVIIPDADGMSVAAKNALLKVIEEPPKNVYFIITIENEGNMLDTILSRSAIYHMDLYKRDEIVNYYHMVCPDGLDSDLVAKLCTTPGEVNLLLAQAGGIDKFYQYVVKVVNNIALVSGSNAFKIGERIAFKDEADKYDLRLFWTAFSVECLDRLSKSPFQYVHGASVTSKYLQEIRNPSINKQMSFVNWILEIREDWLDYANSETYS